MDAARFSACVLFVLLFYGSPGPATLSCAASGTAVGFRRSLPYLFGIVFGLAVNFLVALLGLTVLMQGAPGVVTVMKYLSLAYIVFLATRMMRFQPGGSSGQRALVFGEGVLLNLLNPKAYFASLAVISQFGTGDPGSAWLLLGLVVSIGLTVDLAWCYGGSLLGDAHISPRGMRWIRATLALVLVATAVFATFGS